MNWTQVSPGIEVTDYEGFRITKIYLNTALSTRRDCKGNRIGVNVYNYIACKPGTDKDPFVRYQGCELDKILRTIDRRKIVPLF